MNKFLYTLAYIFVSGAIVTSCAMKDELTGKSEHYSYGDLVLNVSNNAKTDVDTRTESEYNGNKPGVFPAEETNINNYTLFVYDKDGVEQESGLISELGTNGVVSLTLSEGEYTIKAYNYDGSDVNVSERPYFMGSNTMSIKAGTTTDADIKCKLQNIEVAFSLDQSFKDKFKDDYTFTVDNGDGVSVIINKDNVDKKYYLKVPQDKSVLNVSVKATTVATELTEEQPIQRAYKITKPADAEGGTTLAAGDAFLINITEDGSSSSYIDFTMTVDFTFVEHNEVITIPVEEISFNPGEPTVPEEPTDPETAITFEGLPATYTCTNGDTEIPGLQNVRIIAPNGIKNLNVTISGEIARLLGMVNLPETFDICNLDDTVKDESGNTLKDNIIGLGLVTEEEYAELHAGTCTDFTFKLGGLLVLIPQVVPSGDSVFNLSVSDGTNTKDGDITVTVNAKEG